MNTSFTTMHSAASGPAWIQRAALPFWAACLFVFTVFSREIGYVSLAGIDYDLIAYNFYVLYLLVQLRQFYFNQKIIVLLFLMILIGIGSKIYLDLDFLPFWKQLIPITIILLVCYDVFCRYSYKALFEIYVRISYYTAIFGIIQVLVKLFFGIKLMTDYSQIFLDSIALEPSHYAILIMPACIFTLFYFKRYKWQTITLLVALLLTTSSTAYIVMLILMLIIYRRFQILLLMAPLLYFVFNNILLNYDKFNMRLAGFTSYFENNNSYDKVYAATSVSFLTNLEVAFYSLKNNLLFGSGFGGHEEMYMRYFENSIFRFSYMFKLNAISAHSLLIRIISETGLVGLTAYIWGLAKSLLLKADDYHRTISIACLSHFLGKALKLGGYFDYGTPFFAMVLFFNLMDYRNSKKKETA